MDDCYFCKSCIDGYRAKDLKKIEYQSMTTTTRPIPHVNNVSANISVMRSADILNDLPGNVSADLSGNIPPYLEFAQPLPESLPQLEPHSATETPTESTVSSHEEYLGHSSKFTQPELSNTVRRLNLSKDNAELLGSILKDKDLLATNTKITLYRHRETEFKPFLKKRRTWFSVQMLKD